MAVTHIALADHFALQDLQGGEQARGAIALVVVGHRAPDGPSSWAVQAAYGPVPGSGSSRPRTAPRAWSGRIQVQPHHVGELLQKPRIARKLEALDAVRLQIVAAPDIADRGFAHALRWAGRNRQKALGEMTQINSKKFTILTLLNAPTNVIRQIIDAVVWLRFQYRPAERYAV